MKPNVCYRNIYIATKNKEDNKANQNAILYLNKKTSQNVKKEQSISLNIHR